MTAPTVVEIFEMYVADHGLRAIAQALTDKGAPSPSEADRGASRTATREGGFIWRCARF